MNVLDDRTREVLDALPPYIYLPAVEEAQSADYARVAYRRTQDGRLALLVYMALDRLRDAQGQGQPWIASPTGILSSLYETDRYDVIYVDLHVPEENRGADDRSVVG